MTEKQIADIKERASGFQGPIKAAYLFALRYGLDLAVLIAGDNDWPLAKDKTLRDFLDWLDEQ